MCSLAEWEALYQRKSGKPIRTKAFAQVLVDLDKGFMYFAFNDEGDMVICETCGDGKHWEQIALTLAKAQGCRTIYTTIYVRPAVYQRRYPEAKIFQRVNDLTIMYREVN